MLLLVKKFHGGLRDISTSESGVRQDDPHDGPRRDSVIGRTSVVPVWRGVLVTVGY